MTKVRVPKIRQTRIVMRKDVSAKKAFHASSRTVKRFGRI